MAHILIIDDDPVIRLLLRRTLEKLGHTISLAADGIEGLTLIQGANPAPDLVICDWMMPHMDGLEVCRRLKADPELAAIFFILLTAKDKIADRIEGLDAGADDFLTKPIDMGEMMARIRAALRIRDLTRDLQLQKQLLESQLAEAAAYVQSLLPPPMTEPIQINAQFIPSMQLGGDCFDYYWLDPDYLVVYLLDASGHGIGAALLSISVLNMLRSQSLPDVNFYQPANVLEALNENFQMDKHGDRYFTIWYGVYNRVRRQLTYASAGHPPAILISEHANHELEVQRLKSSGMPIGMFPEAKFENSYQLVAPNSSLYIMSDGAYEIMQADETIWGLDKLVEVLKLSKTCKKRDLNSILNSIQSVNLLQNLEDDLSLIQINLD
ncbi:SpoIIE family protein phosphatase [Trichothermofontia sichuanensis B231]|uniref:PP2C family protein-serine/threonine phosphatase n=1 Tax=Trichothermofontia sichuanensis TaxID=3045816 RepID=UPI0022480DE5|nr:SpoIIE family protein phosphatase [Trichothermofontia sichuanensis]UZQ56225.1 SpoIIE family protein phosphatase [Trichothermofontia sichuanensis B231]